MKYNLILQFVRGFKDKKCILELLIMICFAVNLVYMHFTIMDISSFHAYYYCVSNHFFVLLDLVLIYIVTRLFVYNKYHVLYIFYIVSLLYILTNIVYSRYFDTYLPLSLYFEFGNLDGLSSNIYKGITSCDMILIFTSIIATICYLNLKSKRDKNYNISYCSIILVVVLFLFCRLEQKVEKENKRLKMHFSELKDERTILTTFIDEINSTRKFSNKDAFFKYGLFMNILMDYLDSFKGYDDSNINKLVPYLFPADYSLKVEDYPDNIILILLESFCSYPIGKSYSGVELTPFLNELTKTAIYHSRMKSETKLGESSDGQYIYLTGLLPLNDKVTINEIEEDSLVSIPYLLKKTCPNYHTRMVIPTNSQSWGQKVMCKKYGIDALFSNEDYIGDFDNWLSDEQLFSFATSIDKQCWEQNNFMSILLTSSTHSPYNKRLMDVNFNFPIYYSTEFKNYLCNVHYVDKYLGEYINGLKRNGLYEKSLIILVSDHKPNVPQLKLHDSSICNDLPMFIINAPSEFKELPFNIYQTSLFPTIIDLLGLKTKWRGVGKSIFMPDSVSMQPYEQKRKEYEYEISELILNTGYKFLKEQ